MTIRVDARGRPERNGEVLIFDLGQNLEGKDARGKTAKLFGTFPVVRWDKRWSAKVPTLNFYSCRVVSKRTLLIKMPAYEYSLLYGMKSFIMKPDTKACISGMNSGAVGFNEDIEKEIREWKHIALEFPEGTHLSATAINKDAPDGTYLDIEYFAIKVDGRIDTYCGWPVADLSKDTQATGEVKDSQAGKSKEALAREKMEALGI